MRVGALISVVVALAVGCGGKSASTVDDDSESGGSTGASGSGASGGTTGTTGGTGGTQGGNAGTGAAATGGSAGGGAVSGAENCDDERLSMLDLVNANKACVAATDCTANHVGCGVSEDDCTGFVYTNQGVDQELFAYRRLRLEGCVFEHESPEICASCDRVPRPPTCSNGMCAAASACGREVDALWDFNARNDACEVSDDCVQEFVGCEITEDDCTGTVYYAKNFDRAEFERLRDEYYACNGKCGSCLRVTSPPACVGGHCQALPFRE